FGDEFYANDGDSPRFKASLISIEDVVYNLNYPAVVDEKTKKAWADMTLEDKKQCAEIGIDNRGLYGQSKWLPLKPICTPEDLVGPGQNIRVNNFVIMRYAEVLLMYAEACLQTGDTQGAKDAINLVQKHAGSATISDAVDMEVLEREKKYELWLEGCRWADMVRWGHFDGVKTAGQRVPTLYDAMSKDGESAHRFYTVYSYPAMEIRQTETGFKAGKHEYFPYPEAETSLNPNLTQNPGWE
ncbi:MAG: RagB/SusD family nutrient uptake outer membrane protein, partial [Bacteroidales bacterium]|nr:RagB/SusD family nutrient uptake outer membrane protein [Bacteroidales bacterium]